MSIIRILIVTLAIGSLGTTSTTCMPLPVDMQTDDAASADGGSGGVGTLYYARTDGAVAAINIETGDEVAVLSASLFTGANPGAGRVIAFDPAPSQAGTRGRAGRTIRSSGRRCCSRLAHRMPG